METLRCLYGTWRDTLDDSAASHLVKGVTISQYAFYTGFLLGGYQAAQRASLQFMAEHQHALPGIRTRFHSSSLLRLRNAKISLAFANGGVVRGAQLASIGALFYGCKWALAKRHEAQSSTALEAAFDDVVAYTLVGSLLAVAGKGQRLYYLQRGAALGASFGAAISLLNFALSSPP